METSDIIRDITAVKESTKSAHKRIDELQDVVKAVYSLASDVKVLAEQLINMKEDINEVKIKIAKRDEEPRTMYNSFKQTIFNGITMIIIGAIMALIIK